MGKETGIAWCDHTFNTWIGCARVSPGCELCYAEAEWDGRRHRVKWGPRGTRSLTSEAYWQQPFAWDRAAREAGERRRVFCSSLADVFEAWDGDFIDAHGRLVWMVNGRWVGTDSHHVPGERATIHHARVRLWETILATPHLDWLLLTKRPANIVPALGAAWEHAKARKFDDGCLAAWINGSRPPKNVWIGTSVENQKYADVRLPSLLDVPARVRFLSVEPMLGPVDLGRWTGDGIHWVIVGGESSQGGKPARPFDLAWARSLRDQCREAGVPYFLKQLGSHAVDGGVPLRFRDSHGGDMAEWSEDLCVRELPEVESDT